MPGAGRQVVVPSSTAGRERTRAGRSDLIPNDAHFIWFGDDLPWIRFLSIPSALALGGFERGVLHYEAGLERSPIFGELEKLPSLERRVLEPAAILEAAPEPGGGRLVDVYRALEAPAARANVLRAAILHAEGGVYLDLDTITVRDLSPLRSRCGAFYGVEHLVYPAGARESERVADRTAAYLRRNARKAMRLWSRGWRGFRAIERFYPMAANNAVLGAEPGHPLVRRLLEAMIELPPDRRGVQFALGTHLLQRVTAAAREPDLEVLPPPAFYPLGPEISEHWFRERRRMPALRDVVVPETLVVHWYASVRTRHLMPIVDEAWVRAHADTQLFSRLAQALLDGVLAQEIAPR